MIWKPCISTFFRTMPPCVACVIPHTALWEPETPPNTGNTARLYAATGAVLHLIGRLGFRLDDRSLRRAGLDYWDAVDLHRHDSLARFEPSFSGPNYCFNLAREA